MIQIRIITNDKQKQQHRHHTMSQWSPKLSYQLKGNTSKLASRGLNVTQISYGLPSPKHLNGRIGNALLRCSGYRTDAEAMSIIQGGVDATLHNPPQTAATDRPLVK